MTTELEVTHTDGSKETVTVREIPVSKFRAFVLAASWANENEVVGFYTDKPKDLSDSLTHES